MGKALAEAFAGARAVFDELERRLVAEPGVERVAFADRLPVMDQYKYNIEVDTLGGAPTTGVRRSTLVQISRGFLDAFGTHVLPQLDPQRPAAATTARPAVEREEATR